MCQTRRMECVVDFEQRLSEKETCKMAMRWRKLSIYKVSACAMNLHKMAYIPQAVSFGPYHCENKDLHLQMYDHKCRALHHFLVKSNKPLQTYVEGVGEMVQELMDHYDSLAANWQQNAFLQMMLLDGCFMLEILRANEAITKPEDTYGNYSGVEDPIFSYHGKVYMMPHFRRDMLMLQNQLPMMLLHKLLTLEADVEDPQKYLNKIILNFVHPKHTSQSDRVVSSLHVLDLYRKSLLGVGQRRSLPRMTVEPFDIKTKAAEDIIRSAEKLHESGIEFETSETSNLTDISFHHGVLRLPTVIVDDTTESTLLNLMAFERLHVGAGNEVTSFVSFMDNIIDSARDVSILHDSGVIHNAIGSEKAVANMFNGISKDVTPDPEGRLQKVHDALDSYCNRKWNQWRANLKHTYFRNPWALVSLLAAIFLMLLTIAQTAYSIIAYHYPK